MVLGQTAQQTTEFINEERNQQFHRNQSNKRNRPQDFDHERTIFPTWAKVGLFIFAGVLLLAIMLI